MHHLAYSTSLMTGNIAAITLPYFSKVRAWAVALIHSKQRRTDSELTSHW